VEYYVKIEDCKQAANLLKKSAAQGNEDAQAMAEELKKRDH